MGLTQLYHDLSYPLRAAKICRERVDRRCHGDDSTEAGWMLAVRAELKAGQQIILQRLMEAKCARPFLRAGNTEVVRQDGQGSPATAALAQPMSALKKGEAADRDPEEKTDNVGAADAMELKAAKRKLDFEDQAEETKAPKFKGAPPSDDPGTETSIAYDPGNSEAAGVNSQINEEVTETPLAEERKDLSKSLEDAADETTLHAIEGQGELTAKEGDDKSKASEDGAAVVNLQTKEDHEGMPSELRVRDCSVKLHSIDKMLPAGLMEKVKKRMLVKSRENIIAEEILASHPDIRKCKVVLKDLRHHPWYGSKISCMTPCESSTMDVQAEIKEEVDSDEEMMAVMGDAQIAAEEEGSHTDSDEEMMDILDPHENIDAQIRADEDAHSDSDEEALAMAKEAAKLLDCREREKVLDLSKMKECVDSAEYSRVLSFHLAFKQVLATVHVPGPGKYLARNAIKKVYKSAVAVAFPWFDVSNPAANYEANSVEERVVRPPNVDHVYADRSLTSGGAAEKADEQNEISEQVPRWKKYGKRSRAVLAKDTRKCLFCHQQGDAERSRLIYFRQNGELIHPLTILTIIVLSSG